jgi:heat shock protein 90kDa beta
VRLGLQISYHGPFLTSDCSFFERVDRVLRRSLGVSEEAPTDVRYSLCIAVTLLMPCLPQASVRPAPPVDPEMPEELTLPPLEDGQIPFDLPEELKDDFSLVMEPIPEDEYQGYVNAAKHDEL